MSKKRGRPKGSFGKKKREALAAQMQKQGSSPAAGTSRDNRDLAQEPSSAEGASSLGAEEEQELSKKLDSAIEKVISTLSADLRNLKGELREELKTHASKIKKLEKENLELKTCCTELEQKVAKLEKESIEQYALLNKQERFSRRNNLRLVGFNFAENEDCIQIAKSVFSDMGLPDCKVERAHRDGRLIHGRERHILIKLSFYQDKIFLLRNARTKLEGKPFFLTDDLTQRDLKEKRKWTPQVTALYQTGTRLRFSGGVWRQSDGRPYKFTE
ncbi:LINE-1 retrotransposable element ORF1 protein [Holothuria leucospilota]|uniref:LINE-1 retrotransposable element ORF1 protein n=1 Tax=Holothuria leucospilota TaxID=206669 RepID=A0A9Q0YR03_HOLLE|nr:LINE-1 retrotransposable element ORF1 protein [Holothuria leucospilota]